MKRTCILIAACVVCAFAGDRSTDAARRWVAAKFSGVEQPPPPAPHMTTGLRPGTLLKDRIQGHRLMIAGRTFERGLAMRAPGEVVVKIPVGVRTLEASVGVDSNDVGYYSNAGRGSVAAAVAASGRELFRSPVMREGMQAIPVRVDLGGAREFTLRLTAEGKRSPIYQREWDQADWADARVTLTDGTTLALADLPIGAPAQAYTPDPPFSFQYAGRASAELLKTWPVERAARKLDEHRTEYTARWRDPATQLAVRSVAIAYDDFPIVEWTVYFKNDGTSRTPILESIRGIDTQLDGQADGKALLHHAEGSHNGPTDFRPLETALGPEETQHYASLGGRPSDGVLPFFNLEWTGRGVVFAIGWPGQWSLDVSRDKAADVRISGGQETTRFWLEPGEEVRTPLNVVEFWDGAWLDGQDTWRRWMVAHNLPRTNGKLPPPQLAGGSSRYTNEQQESTEENQKLYIDRTLAAKLPIDHWWMDAGWYPFKTGWPDTGTWEPDPARFPRGIRPVSDYAHSKGLKMILWFEPERVRAGTWLAEHHPEWLIGPDGKDKLLYLGNPEALEWLIGHMIRLLDEQGIDLYRQDFNFTPLERWRAADTPGREGIAENKHVTGYLAYFDALLKRFPDLRIDTCASGGRRLDLETLRRAVPLWRSDYPYVPDAMQMQTYGLAPWVPYHGTAINSIDPYFFRSQMTPGAGLGFDPNSIDNGRETLTKLLAQWREASRFYYGDFTPLTPYSTEDTAWMAWQFGQPDGKAGMIQAFRRANSPFDSARFKLRGLDPAARYSVKDLDTGRAAEFAGRELLDKGLPVSIDGAPGSVLLVYEQTAS